MHDDARPRLSPGLADGEPGSAVWVTRLGAQTAVLTALLLYFGWVRTNATYRYFGVDLSLLDFATSDLVLRSVSAVYQPLLVLGLVMLAAHLAHEALASPEIAASHPRAAATIQRGVLIGGLILVAGAIAAIVSGVAGFWFVLALTIGLALLRYAGARGSAAAGAPKADPTSALVLSALVVLAAFWTVALFAERAGERRGAALAHDLKSRGSLVVYARKPLMLAGPGIEQVKVGTAGPYEWRYTGLRLLVRNGKRYFVVSKNWQQRRSSVYVLPEDETVRFEVTSRYG